MHPFISLMRKGTNKASTCIKSMSKLAITWRTRKEMIINLQHFEIPVSTCVSNLDAERASNCHELQQMQSMNH